MNSVTRIARWPLFFMVGVAGGMLVGCNSGSQAVSSQTSKYEVAEDAEGTAGESSSVASEAAAGAGAESPVAETPGRGLPMATAAGGKPVKPSTTPPATTPVDDSAEGQLTLIRQLSGRQVTSLPEFQEVQSQVIAAAEKVLSGSATDEQQVEAAGSKIAALMQLGQVGSKDAAAQMVAFTGQLQQSASRGLKQLGVRMAFAKKLEDWTAAESLDAAAVLADLQQFLTAEDQDALRFNMGSKVAQILEQAEFQQQASEAYKAVAESLAKSENPQVQEARLSLLEVARLSEANLNQYLKPIYGGDESAIEPFIAAAQGLLSAEGVGSTTFSVFQGIGPDLEVLSPPAAKQLYTALSDAFSKHPDEELATQAKTMLDKYLKRSSLLGQPFAVSGVTLDGSPFDWNQYKGKVVLVDFWATWCGPCLAEIPNIKKNLERYKSAGFEVVGVNLDDNAEDLKQFLSYQQLPWPSVISENPQTRGWNHPLAEQCGVIAIPFLVLVGPDGKVLALNTRGEQLGEKLAELFPGS